MESKIKDNKITLQLDELFKNSVSPETIAEEVRKAAAEYYAETAAKNEKEEEYQKELKEAREKLSYAFLNWYYLAKNLPLEDIDSEALVEDKFNTLETIKDFEESPFMKYDANTSTIFKDLFNLIFS